MDKVFTVLFWVFIYFGIILIVCDAIGINRLSDDDEETYHSSQPSARYPLV